MVLRSLALTEDRANAVVLDDERGRHANDTDRERAASITFAGRDSSWGEFLSLEDVALIHAWTGELLAEPFRQ